MFLLIDCELICFNSYNVKFVGMALPEMSQDQTHRYAAPRAHGNFFVGVTTINQRGKMVLESTTGVAPQQTTVYAFNGQGTQEEAVVWE